ncbi:MAG TPA: efflux RND transporter periplasmic adaptor subunit [bacterium]|nr:efflux RND transporter periplasmic adaptor subunit [bacterium]
MTPRTRIRALALPALLVLLAVALLLAGCNRREPVQGAMTDERHADAGDASKVRAEATAAVPQPAGADTPRAATLTPVEVEQVKPRDFTLTSTYIGYLLPQERVELRSEIEGVAERVQFDEGQAVKAGQLLVNISTEEMTVRRDQAKADLRLAQSNFQRDSSLHAKQLVTDAQLEQSRTRRDLAEYALRLAELQLKKSRVISPLAGTVKTRGVDRGEFLNKGQLIAEILDVSKVRALFNVPEREVRYLKPGRRVDVTFEALPGESVTGSVRLVGLEADTKTRTFPVEVELDNAQGRLRPGMLVRVRVPLEQYRGQLMIPRYAMLERERERVVYIVRDGKAVERVIESGASSEGMVQVLKGLEPGDLVIVTGQQKLTPGEPVDARPARH